MTTRTVSTERSRPVPDCGCTEYGTCRVCPDTVHEAQGGRDLTLRIGTAVPVPMSPETLPAEGEPVESYEDAPWTLEAP